MAHIIKPNAKKFTTNGQRNLLQLAALTLIQPHPKPSLNTAKRPTKTSKLSYIAIIAQKTRQNGKSACHFASRRSQKLTTTMTRSSATFTWAQKLRTILSLLRLTACQPTTSLTSSTMQPWASRMSCVAKSTYQAWATISNFTKPSALNVQNSSICHTFLHQAATRS